MADRLAACVCVATMLFADFATAQEDPKDVVAAAVRESGYECTAPQEISADPENTSSDEKAWVIRCEERAYRVKFLGDRGAEVEPLAE
jgi:hypothetical protein